MIKESYSLHAIAGTVRDPDGTRRSFDLITDKTLEERVKIAEEAVDEKKAAVLRAIAEDYPETFSEIITVGEEPITESTELHIGPLDEQFEVPSMAEFIELQNLVTQIKIKLGM